MYYIEEEARSTFSAVFSFYLIEKISGFLFRRSKVSTAPYHKQDYLVLGSILRIRTNNINQVTDGFKLR